MLNSEWILQIELVTWYSPVLKYTELLEKESQTLVPSYYINTLPFLEKDTVGRDYTALILFGHFFSVLFKAQPFYLGLWKTWARSKFPISTPFLCFLNFALHLIFVYIFLIKFLVITFPGILETLIQSSWVLSYLRHNLCISMRERKNNFFKGLAHSHWSIRRGGEKDLWVNVKTNINREEATINRCNTFYHECTLRKFLNSCSSSFSVVLYDYPINLVLKRKC